MARQPDPPHRLSEIPLFAGLPKELLNRLAGSSWTRTYRPEEVVVGEGEPGVSLIVLEAGQLRVSRYASTGQELVLDVIDAPAALGELSLIDGAPRSATVTAQHRSFVRHVPRQAFWELLKTEFAFVEGLLKTLAGWVRDANARHADLVGLDVPGRFAKWLLARAERLGTLSFDLGQTQSQLAAELGTTRSTLNRAIQGFVSLDIIEYDDPHVTIRNSDALRAFLG